MAATGPGIVSAMMELKCMSGFSGFLTTIGFAACVTLMIHVGHCQINASQDNNEQRGNRISAKLVVASLVATLAGSQRSAIVSERIVERSSCRQL
jgi:uncharacterized PurR-regulated membrane protein YhhQ (DUF165 family)